MQSDWSVSGDKMNTWTRPGDALCCTIPRSVLFSLGNSQRI